MKKLALVPLLMLLAMPSGQAQELGNELGGSTAPRASTGHADLRVERTLNELGYKFNRLGNGSFQVAFRLAGRRKQIAIIDSKTYRYGPFEIREIWSPAYQAPGIFPTAVSLAMLADSAKRKLGGWQVIKRGRLQVGVFTAKIPANASGQTFKSALLAVLNVADSMERKITGRDEL